MRFKKSASLFVILSGIILGSAQPASAQFKLFLEPYAGWALAGKSTLSQVPTDSDQGSFSGLGLGARAGIGILGIVFVGADLNYLPSLNVTPTDASVFESGAKVTRLGIVAGVNVPVVPLRFWLGYNFSDKLNNTPQTARSGIPAGTEVGLNGNGIKAGIGFTPLPLLSFNAEYIYSKYDSITLNGVDTPLSAGTAGIINKVLLLSLSVPLSLGY